ncbi:unnamed protein product, partial [Rotaria sordida]
LETKRFREH